MNDRSVPLIEEPEGSQTGDKRFVVADVIGSAGRFIWTGLKDLPTAVLTVLLLWFFQLKPDWKPWEPPQENSATISNVALVEREFQPVKSEDTVFLVVLFDIETVGYDRREVGIATLLIDPETKLRIWPEMRKEGPLEDLTRTDRSVVWLEIPYPNPGPPCIVVRVYAYELPNISPTTALQPLASPEPTIAPTPLTRFPDRTMIAYADSAPFDVYEPKGPGSCPVPNVATPPAA